MTDPRTVALRNAAMRNAARTTDLNVLMDQFAAAMDEQLSQAAAAIASLNSIASTAATAIAASATDRAQLNNRVGALEARRLTTHTAQAAVPVLNGTSTIVTVTWATPFSDTNYTVSDPVVSSAVLGKVAGVVTATTPAGCTIRLTGTAVSLGSTVTVEATRYA